jgi:hypothetical protein
MARRCLAWKRSESHRLKQESEIRTSCETVAHPQNRQYSCLEEAPRYCTTSLHDVAGWGAHPALLGGVDVEGTGPGPDGKQGEPE